MLSLLSRAFLFIVIVFCFSELTSGQTITYKNVREAVAMQLEYGSGAGSITLRFRVGHVWTEKLQIPSGLGFPGRPSGNEAWLSPPSHAFLSIAYTALAGASVVIPYRLGEDDIALLFLSPDEVVVARASDRGRAYRLKALEPFGRSEPLNAQHFDAMARACVSPKDCVSIGKRGILTMAGTTYEMQYWDWSASPAGPVECIRVRQSELVRSPPDWFATLGFPAGPSYDAEGAMAKSAFSLDGVTNNTTGLFPTGIVSTAYPQDPPLWISGGNVTGC